MKKVATLLATVAVATAILSIATPAMAAPNGAAMRCGSIENDMPSS